MHHYVGKVNILIMSNSANRINYYIFIPFLSTKLYVAACAVFSVTAGYVTSHNHQGNINLMVWKVVFGPSHMWIPTLFRKHLSICRQIKIIFDAIDICVKPWFLLTVCLSFLTCVTIIILLLHAPAFCLSEKINCIGYQPVNCVNRHHNVFSKEGK